MADIERNRRLWGEEYHWKDEGNEWSASWGGADMQWYGSILPRISRYVPAARILEIAPGFGRWTHWLRTLTKDLILVDLSEKCIEHCRKRFAKDSHISFFANDGRSLDMIENASLDFVFSFDSLVHAETDVIGEYISQLSSKLRSGGVAFIHHSNIGACRIDFSSEHSDAPDHGRAHSVSAESVKEQVERSGLHCVSQEIFCWGGAILTDCITVFCYNDSRWAGSYASLVNLNYMEEAERLRRLSSLYGMAPFFTT